MSKKMRRMAAIAMAAAMVVSTPVGASGTDSGTTATTTAASGKVYYKQNVTTVVVPTELTVAFNPNNLKVSVDGVEKTDDIVSRPVAIVSEATKDKKVAVSFAVAASDNSGIKFVDSQTAANTGTDLNVCLQLVAATGGISIPGSGTTSGTTIEVASGTSGSDVVYTRSYTAAKLAKASMTAAGSGSSGTVTIKNNTAVGFRLDKANYEYDTIDLDSGATSNQIEGTLSGLGNTGYTAFNFTGYLNDNADWYSVNNATISITPTYTITDAAATDTAITGFTGFMGVTTAGSGSSSSAGSGSSSSQTDDYKMTASNGGYTYTFVNKPSGTLTAVLVDGTDKSGAISKGNITYADGVFTINSTATTANSLTTGNHTIKAAIGAGEYTLTITN